jgi:hypothetical protein
MRIITLASLLLLTCVFSNVNAQHAVILLNGERYSGELQSVKDNTVTFFHKGTTLTFHVAEVKSIEFNQPIKSGDAAGTGVNSGTKGVSYVMPGRKLVKQPKIDNLTMEKGIVVVAITINKYGDVVKAEPGAEGTTTTSQYLLTKAKQAAESAKFDGGTTMPLEQRGAITLTF